MGALDSTEKVPLHVRRMKEPPLYIFHSEGTKEFYSYNGISRVITVVTLYSWYRVLSLLPQECRSEISLSLLLHLQFLVNRVAFLASRWTSFSGGSLAPCQPLYCLWGISKHPLSFCPWIYKKKMFPLEEPLLSADWPFLQLLLLRYHFTAGVSGSDTESSKKASAKLFSKGRHLVFAQKKKLFPVPVDLSREILNILIVL